MTIYAKFEVKTAWLAKEFGDSYARRLFGNEVVDALPKYVKGNNLGKPRAEICWVKCTRGGWTQWGVENRRGSTVYAVLKDCKTREILATDREFFFWYEEMVKG